MLQMANEAERNTFDTTEDLSANHDYYLWEIYGMLRMLHRQLEKVPCKFLSNTVITKFHIVTH